MPKPIRLASLLLLSTAFSPAAAFAQGAPVLETDPAVAAEDESSSPDGEVEVSAPGAQPDQGEDIVVTGRNIPNVLRNAPEVVTILSSEDIARTGEGDIAGALQRVTGLSVVGNGFVFVRGLGDRYSLALLNGSPLPSPEPLRRVVPLDIFPTGLIASSVVQKSYSVNYPGEFGGGVINLTTTSIPDETFLTVGASAELDGETTGHLGYSHYGSDLDPLGFDDGTRDMPAGLRSAVAGGGFNGDTTAAQRRDFAAALVNAPTTLLQRIDNVAPNMGGNISAGTAFDLLGARIGVLGAVGYSNGWRTRDSIQQISLDPELAGAPQSSFRRVTTDNRILVNAMLGLGAEIGKHKLRWTNLFIHDTLKQGRLAAGFNRSVQDQDPNLPPSIIEQNTYWFERQLLDTQFVGEFKFGDFSVDLRGTWANSKRESPYERDISYTYLGDGNPATKSLSDVDDYVNNLTSGGQSATIAFNDLSEDVHAGGIDFAYRLSGAMPTTLSAGYAYTKSRRDSSRYQFQYFRPEGALPIAVAQERPDFLLSDFNIYNFNIQLRDISGAEGAAAYEAGLRIHAGYAQAEVELPGPALRAQFGVRYEDAVETVLAGTAATRIANDYWLPAATITWNLADNMQLRVHGSKTIARPQFRELAPQIYQDFESDREFTGNPFLTDSRLTNAEARYEYYFRRGERFSLAGFYKKIDNPIESAAFFAGGGQLRTGFANAPQATLYGVEAELQTYLPLSGLGTGFADKRLLLIGNYTYTKSKVKSDDTLVIGPDLQPVAANLLFQDGAPLTGQSDHLANIQFGIENTDRLSQATFLLTYASERVTERGPIQGSARQPDIVERPGLRLDFVAREAIRFLGRDGEIKFEARNLLGQDYEEFQQFEENRIDINSYKVGRTVSVGMSLTF
jgi:outer membrane receptor protein involved in Fe transport